MHLRPGIPLAADVEAMKRNDAFDQHVEFNRNFIAAHSAALKGYGFHWGDDPLRLWSRRWEYPFSAQKILDFAASAGGETVRILDAGSGVTYFPYMLCSHLPRAQVTCCDSNSAYERMFAAINEQTPGSRVTFKTALLQSLPLEDASQDAICCISVLEHTDNYRAILSEFRRVLRPGGLLVLTFDLSLDGRFKLSRDQATELLSAISEMYKISGVDVNKDLARLDHPGEILSTDMVRRTEPELLPWKYPKLMAIRDLLSGKGWTGGFRSKSVFCLEARKPN